MQDTLQSFLSAMTAWSCNQQRVMPLPKELPFFTKEPQDPVLQLFTTALQLAQPWQSKGTCQRQTRFFLSGAVPPSKQKHSANIQTLQACSVSFCNGTWNISSPKETQNSSLYFPTKVSCCGNWQEHTKFRHHRWAWPISTVHPWYSSAYFFY